MATAGKTAPSRDLTGERFERLTVITWVPSHARLAQWLCQCDCGARTIVCSGNLRGGKVRSCGCLRAEPYAYKHGAVGSRLYGVWGGMKKRCGTPTAINFHNYGGRGISVCDEWRDDFAAFKSWALAHGYSDDLFIDRIDNDGPYSPTNCRFVDRVTNNRKRRITRVFTLHGETMTWADAAERYGVNYHTIKARIYAGYSPEQAIQPKVNTNEKTGTPLPRVVAQQLRRSAARSLRNRALREQGSEASG